jgi:CxxC motif-containing protein (DUF1111 family)
MRVFWTLSLVAFTALGGLMAHSVQTSPQRPDLTDKELARVRMATRAPTDFTKPQQFERMSGGATTTGKVLDSNIFSHFSNNLTFEERSQFLVGNGLFRKDWVSAPSSTQASDGLGPLFNARSCQGCHLKDGRGHAPEGPEDDAVSLLVRLSVPPSTPDEHKKLAERHLSSIPDPVYGGQLQDFAVPGLKAEGRVRVTYEDVAIPLNGGETATLRKPTFALTDPGYGAFREDLMISPRVAPPMIGLGLLEAIHENDILAKADPDDADGDGISGRPNYVRDGQTGKVVLGRFGWKANQPNLMQQNGHAFAGDMGLSSRISPSPQGDCSPAQKACFTLPTGVQERYGPYEVTDKSMDFVDFYTANLAVPARRDVNDPDVLAGKKLFHDAGCASCHTPSYVTAKDTASRAQKFQLIWPYTDLLLHDMGPDLADNRPDGDASGTEWRTPPLWGIGLTKTVHKEATFLHDGRARTVLEAVLWHGGEAQKARDAVVGITPADRNNLIRFLESL